MRTRRKAVSEPWCEAFLNSFLPGLGALRGGDRTRGIAWAGSFAAALGAAIALLLAFALVPGLRITSGRLLLLRGLALAAGLVYLASVVAPLTRRAAGTPSHTGGDPWREALLSRFVPGLGLILRGRLPEGFAFAAAWLAVLLFVRGTWLLVIAAPLVLASIARTLRLAAAAGARPPRLRDIGRGALVVACASLLLSFTPWRRVRDHVFLLHRVTGGAMEPRIRGGDWIIIDRFLYRLRGIKRGEVYAFNCPDRPGKFYIKRIVGLPGETIEIRDGRILTNGTRLVTGCVIDSIPYRNYGPYGRRGIAVAIPEGSYFFLGDRLAHSLDSRFYGPIPLRDIVGRAVKIVRPGRRAGPVR